MSELRKKASLELAQKLEWSLQTVQEADRVGGIVRFSFPYVIGLIESRFLAEQQRDQARELLAQGVHAIITDIDGNHSASDEFPDDGCEICIWARKTHEFLAPSRADAQEES